MSLVALNPVLEANCALLVDRLLGLRTTDICLVDAARRIRTFLFWSRVHRPRWSAMAGNQPADPFSAPSLSGRWRVVRFQGRNMALAHQISNLFKKKPQEPAADSVETIAQDPLAATPSAAVDYDSRGRGDSTVMVSTLDEPEGAALPADDTFALPLLGARSAAQHQRLLSILLALALVVLAAMVYWTVSQTDLRGARQVGAIGQSLMQSQRLAKSVSQALVGSPEAFPELKESSAALSSNVHGLQNGNDKVLRWVTPTAPKWARLSRWSIALRKTRLQCSPSRRR